MSDIRYMVMVIRPWSSVQVCVSPFDARQPLRVDGLGVGFIPVFESWAEALAFARGDESLVFVVGVRRAEEE